MLLSLPLALSLLLSGGATSSGSTGGAASQNGSTQTTNQDNPNDAEADARAYIIDIG